MAETKRTLPTKVKNGQKVLQLLISWPVVGAVAVLLLGFGGSLMTSPHPYIADAFCVVGIFTLLVKFWTWEGAKHDTPRKTALLLVGVTFILFGIGGGLCVLSNYLSKPAPVAQVEFPIHNQSPSPAVPTVQSPPSVAQRVPIPAPVAPIGSNLPPCTPGTGMNIEGLQMTVGPGASNAHVTNLKVRGNPCNLSAKDVRTNLQTKGGTGTVTNVDVDSTPSALRAQQPTYQQKCDNGSPCAQGPGAQAIVNHFGLPKLSMTDIQRDKIRDAMKPFAGAKVRIVINVSSQDSITYGDQLVSALNQAGLIVESSKVTGNFAWGVRSSGVSLVFSENHRSVAGALADALHQIGAVAAPVPSALFPFPSPVEGGFLDINIQPGG